MKIENFMAQFSSVQVTQSGPTLFDPMNCSTPGLPVHHQLPEFTQTCVHWVGDAIQPSHPLSSLSPPALNLSQHQGLFKWVSIRWPKYWSFSFSISPSSENSGLISFRMDWLDLLAVQGTLKSPPAPQFSPTLTCIHDYWKKYSCLENPMDRGAWQATVCGVVKSRTWLKRLSTHAG